MWIRSQDKTEFIKADRLGYNYDEKEITKETGRTIKWRGIKQPEKEVIGFVEEHYILANGYRVATYSTEEKAMKVLDMIEKHINNGGRVFCVDQVKTDIGYCATYEKVLNVFQMPQDSEVEE